MAGKSVDMILFKNVKRISRRILNYLLDPVDLEIIRRHQSPQDYIPFEETLEDAARAGISVGAYIEKTYDVPGSTQATFDHLNELGVFSRQFDRICEIGPGSGRYLDKTIQICKPSYFEIYETASKWRTWLTETYGVIAQPTDGRTLSSTRSRSVSLVQSHKTFSSVVSFIDVCSYFLEMARVVQNNGLLVFDLVTEDCVDHLAHEDWFQRGSDWPFTMIAREFALNFFIKRGFNLLGSFFISMKPINTQYFVFEKNPEKL